MSEIKRELEMGLFNNRAKKKSETFKSNTSPNLNELIQSFQKDEIITSKRESSRSEIERPRELGDGLVSEIKR